MLTLIIFAFRFLLIWTALSVLSTLGICTWIAMKARDRNAPPGRPGDME